MLCFLHEINNPIPFCNNDDDNGVVDIDDDDDNGVVDDDDDDDDDDSTCNMYIMVMCSRIHIETMSSILDQVMF